jgi:hypothetical protein
VRNCPQQCEADREGYATPDFFPPSGITTTFIQGDHLIYKWDEGKGSVPHVLFSFSDDVLFVSPSRRSGRIVFDRALDQQLPPNPYCLIGITGINRFVALKS